LSEVKFSIGLYGNGGKVLRKFRPIPVKIPPIELVDEKRLVMNLEPIKWKIPLLAGHPEGFIIYTDEKEWQRGRFIFAPTLKRGQNLALTNLQIIIHPDDHKCPLGGKWE
jgi:hypothetical protein